MNLALARLALRRSLPLGLVLVVSALLAYATQIDWAPPGEWSVGAGLPASAFAREGIWTTGLLVLTPLLVHSCAATIRRWRAGDVAWLAQAPLSRSSILFSTWIGHAAAAGLAAGAVAVAAEFGARDFAPTYSVAGRAPAPHGAIVDETTTLRWTVDEPPPLGVGAHARVGVVLVAGAPTADVHLSVARRAGDGSVLRTSAMRHVAASSSLDVEVPEGAGALEFELARQGAGAIVALDGAGVAWLVPRSSAAWISVELAVNVWLALSALCALALGLGAWVSRGIATALVATLVFVNWLADATALDAWMPWASVPVALDLAGRGVGATPVSANAWIGAAACVVVGLVLARASVAIWSRAE